MGFLDDASCSLPLLEICDKEQIPDMNHASNPTQKRAIAICDRVKHGGRLLLGYLKCEAQSSLLDENQGLICVCMCMLCIGPGGCNCTGSWYFSPFP
jgi:hypothetical protein